MSFCEKLKTDKFIITSEIGPPKGTDLKEMLEDGEFPAGSMGPKIESAISFLTGGGREVIITSPEKFLNSVEGKGGTLIVRSEI